MDDRSEMRRLPPGMPAATTALGEDRGRADLREIRSMTWFRTVLILLVLASGACALDADRQHLLDTAMASMERSKGVVAQTKVSAEAREGITRMIDEFKSELVEIAGSKAYRPGGRWEKKRREYLVSADYCRANGKTRNQHDLELKVRALDHLVGVTEVPDFAEIRNVDVF